MKETIVEDQLPCSGKLNTTELSWACNTLAITDLHHNHQSGNAIMSTNEVHFSVNAFCSVCVLSLPACRAELKWRSYERSIRPNPLALGQEIDLVQNAALNHTVRTPSPSALPTMPPLTVSITLHRRLTHLPQRVHGLGEDGLPVSPNKHDEDHVVHH